MSRNSSSRLNSVRVSVDRALAAQDLARAGVERAGRRTQLRRRRRLAAQERSQPGQQLLERERLHEVVVGARVETGDAVADGAAGRQHQDRDAVAVGAEPSRNLEPVDAGQHHVEDRAASGGRVREAAKRLARRPRRPRARSPRSPSARTSASRTAGSSSTIRIRIPSRMIARAVQSFVRRRSDSSEALSRILAASEVRAGLLAPVNERREHQMHSRTKLVAVAAAVAALVGGGAAVASGQAGFEDDQDAVLEAAADELGVEPAALSTALVNALSVRIDAAVAAGTFTAQQGAELKQRLAGRRRAARRSPRTARVGPDITASGTSEAWTPRRRILGLDRGRAPRGGWPTAAPSPRSPRPRASPSTGSRRRCSLRRRRTSQPPSRMVG